ncbi:hypothetical protein C8Q76DRAFT_431268 [Earliella scabrosa]|nr:hypothetical protein C8Q76DRAFT_431268 [Earliella scabrosa]
MRRVVPYDYATVHNLLLRALRRGLRPATFSFYSAFLSFSFLFSSPALLHFFLTLFDMYVTALVILALAALGVQAAPMKRQDNASSEAPQNATEVPQASIPNLGNVNATLIPQWSAAGVNIDPAVTPNPTSVISFIQANPDVVETAIGSKTAMQIEAAMVFAQVTAAVGPSPAGLTVFQQVRSVTPEVLVSAIGGDAVTIATGTAVGAETTLAGQVFTAAPVKANNGAFGLVVPGPLAAGGVVAAASVLFGALAVI